MKCLICIKESSSQFCKECDIDIGILSYASHQRKDALNRIIDKVVLSR